MIVEDIVPNLINGWELTNDVQRERGRAWYPNAHDLAWIVGHGNVRLGAGLLAATSPNKGWIDNQRIALLAMDGVFSGQVGDALRKAERIYNGEDPDLVLPRGKKTWNFFHNIETPDAPDYVTLDRHAIRLATWDWDNGSPRITRSQYPVMASAFIQTARYVGETTSAFQAGLWIMARER